MPRHIDPEVERKIVLAAKNLWHKGGEKGLSMRAVARAAGTNTPAVYRRFRSRVELLRALAELYQLELFRALEPCRSLQEMARCYLDFAVRHPREYALIMSGPVSRALESRPNLRLSLCRCAEWFGGEPDQYVPLVHALVCIVHGHALLKIAGHEPWASEAELQAAVERAVDVLVRSQESLRATDLPSRPQHRKADV